MKHTFKLAIIASLISCSATASAVFNVDGGGQLISVNGLLFEGANYDVSFVDGNCADLFSGCDSDLDFIFDLPTAADFGVVLLDVISDHSLGSFDTDPELTAGCESLSQCNILLPYAISLASSDVSTVSARNGNNSPFTDGVFSGPDLSPGFDLTASGDRTWGIVTVSDANATAIPLPASGVLLLGAFGLIAARKVAFRG